MKIHISWHGVFVGLACIILGILMVLRAPLSTFSFSLRSPVPSFLSMIDNSQVTTIDTWEPKEVLGISENALYGSLTAKSAYAYDTTTDQVLFSKDENTRLPMASLTKIMTAIVALENPKKDDKYLVTKEDLVGEDSMGLGTGEVLSLSDLLYGLFLHSGNDAAETIARNFSGGRGAFITSMNLKAQSLGLSHTHFTNPTGLEGDGDQYATAEDLVVMTRYALANFPLFATVASTIDYTIPQTSTHKEYDLENETNLLTTYPGVKGIKTGYTPEAGLCLVTYLDYGGHQILAVILGSENRRQEMKDILDYSLKKLDVTPPPHE